MIFLTLTKIGGFDKEWGYEYNMLHCYTHSEQARRRPEIPTPSPAKENMGSVICSSQKCVCIYIYMYNQVSAIVLIPFVLIKSLISCLTKSHSLIKLCCFQKNWCVIPKFLSLIS